jgi:GntR family transcriptional regulator
MKGKLSSIHHSALIVHHFFMRFWLSKNSRVSVREQLTTQVILGIVSGDLAPGARLPSTREIARRFRIHANTVSAAYRELTEKGWIEFRQGSGVYVQTIAPEPASSDSQLALDRIIAAFLRDARTRGFTLEHIKRRVADWLELQPPDHFLLIEPDPDLRRILADEITTAIDFPLRATGIDGLDATQLAGAAPTCLYGQAERTRALLPAGTTLLLLNTRSVPDALRGEQRPPTDALITVVSGWSDFLRYARSILLAAGLDEDALDFRSTHDADWQRSLHASHFVITDTLTARSLSRNTPTRIFRVIADSSITELRDFVAEFLVTESDNG